MSVCGLGNTIQLTNRKMLNLRSCLVLALTTIATIGLAAVQAVDLVDKDAQITLYRVSPTDELGVYKYAYSTSNGIEVQAAGSALEAIGFFKYTAPEGDKIEVRYIADEEGFHAVGRHLPTPPPIPDYILRSLEYIRQHPNSEDRARYRVWK